MLKYVKSKITALDSDPDEGTNWRRYI